MTLKDDLQDTMDKVVKAMYRLVSGDPEPYKALWSHTNDVTVLGGVGGFALGWKQVSENANAAALPFHGAKSFEIKKLASSLSGDLAYSVWIEHGDVRVGEREDYVQIVVRVTHVFRQEDGVWKIVHRHSDTVLDKAEAEAILLR